MRQTQTQAPFIVQKREKQAKRLAKRSQKQATTNVDVHDVNKTDMPICNDVMRLKNKVSEKVWLLAVNRAGTDSDYVLLKQAIDKLLR